MKKIVCELCEGTEFSKENGVFVCQGCGTKYSLEEAKNMMREVEDAVPAATAPQASPASIPAGIPVGIPVGMPAVGIPQVNPNQQQIENILLLASTAYEAQNYKEAENYCNRAIELDAMSYKAWNLKGKAVGWQSKIGELRIEEAAHSFCKAIDFAPDDEKEAVKSQAVEELRRLGLALISLRKQRFSGNPSKEELEGFQSGKKVLIDSLLVLLKHGNAVEMPKDFLKDIAIMMTDAAKAGFEMSKNAWHKVIHPSRKDFEKYLGWLGNVETLLQQATTESDDDDEADILRYQLLVDVLECPLNACSYKQQWNPYTKKQEWVTDTVLAESAKNTRSKNAAIVRNKISALQKAAADKKSQRIAAYWAAHPEEKAKLESNKAELLKRKAELDSQINDFNRKIQAENERSKEPTPSDEERESLYSRRKELTSRKSQLGVFAGREKKLIDEELETITNRLQSLHGKIEGEKKERAAEIEKTVAGLNAQKYNIQKTQSEVIRRITAIDNELTKDPG